MYQVLNEQVPVPGLSTVQVIRTELILSTRLYDTK